MTKALLGIALALGAAAPTSAAGPTATPATFSIPGPDLSAVSHAAPVLVLLLAIAAGGIYVMKHGLPRSGAHTAANRKLQIAEMRSLGNRQFLVVVEYEETKMLLGVTPGKIDYLCPIESGPVRDFLVTDAPPADQPDPATQ